MASNGTITIRIINEEAQPETPQGDATGTKEARKSQRSDLQTAAITSVIQKAAHSVKEMGASQIRFQVNRYFEITDDYLGQQSLNICLGIARKVESAAMSIAGGALVAGPVGAIIMGAVELGKTGLDIYQNYSQQNLQLRKMDAQLDYSRQRAGYSLTAGSQGENR